MLTFFLSPELVLFIYNINEGKVENKITFSYPNYNLKGISQPVWNPVYNNIAFIGHDGFSSDIYIYHLDTKEVKNMNEDSKIKIVEVLWNIIYSDNNPDIYENNLMRRLTGLLYLDPKVVGNIKEKTINKKIKNSLFFILLTFHWHQN